MDYANIAQSPTGAQQGRSLLFVASGGDHPMQMNARRPKLRLNLSGYVGARDHLVVLNTYEAATDHFPFVYRPHVDPESATNKRGEFDLQRYEHRRVRRVDHILVIGPRPAWVDGSSFQVLSNATLGTTGELCVYERTGGGV